MERTLVAEDPRIVVRTVSPNRSDGNLTVTASGSTNREGGTAVAVELVGTDGAALASTVSVVNATGRWTATLTVADTDPGPLTLRAFDGEAAAEAPVAPAPPTTTGTAATLSRVRTSTESTPRQAGGTESTTVPAGTAAAVRGPDSPDGGNGSPTGTGPSGPVELPAGLGLPVLGGLAGVLAAAAAWRARGRP